MTDLIASALAQTWARQVRRIIFDLDGQLVGVERESKQWRNWRGGIGWQDYPESGYTEERHQRNAQYTPDGKSVLPATDDDPSVEWRLGEAIVLEPLRRLLDDMEAAEHRLGGSG